jgi:hypothetical protein
MTDDALVVYLELAMGDKVRLLKNPHGRLSPGLVDVLGRTPVAGAALFTSDEPKGTGFRLAAALAEQLDHFDGQLEEWWAELDPDDQDHMVKHCDQELDAAYAPLVLAAGEGDDGDDALVPQIEQNSVGGFRLAGIVEVFVEKKASERRA